MRAFSLGVFKKRSRKPEYLFCYLYRIIPFSCNAILNKILENISIENFN